MANGLLDLLGGALGTTPPAYLQGLLGENAVEDLRKRSIGSGLVNALVGYAAAPKNQNLGLGRILAGAAQSGIQGAQGVYQNATQDYMMQQRLAEMKRQQDQDVASRNAIDMLLQRPEVANDPMATAFIRTNPAEALKMYATPRDANVKVVGNSLVDPSGKVIYTEPSDNALKAPPSRERIVDGNLVQEVMIGAPTTQNPTGSWQKIGSGPRFKAEAPQVPVIFDNTVLDFAAQQYLKTGIMPSLGAGSSKMRQDIITRAAQINQGQGMTAAEGAEQMVANKATSAGILQLQKQKTMVGAFEKNAMRNADIALRLSDQTDRSGIPVFNTWLQRGQKSISGNPTVSAFNAANETFVNEYAKIMSGSMGNTPVSDSARAHAHEMLSTTQTKEQYSAVLKVLKEEMKNRMVGFEEELKEAKASLSPISKSSASSTMDAVQEELAKRKGKK